MVKKAGRTALFAFLVIALAGCSSVPMPKGTSKGYSTVQLMPPNKPIGTDSAPYFVDGNRMIRQSISKVMNENGMKMVDTGGDLIAAHLIILQDNISTTYNNQFYGYQDFSEILDIAHKKGTNKSYPVAVRKRALVIDLIDARTYKLVYRNYVLGGSQPDLTEEERQAGLDAAVEQTLQQFFKK